MPIHTQATLVDLCTTAAIVKYVENTQVEPASALGKFAFKIKVHYKSLFHRAKKKGKIALCGFIK